MMAPPVIPMVAEILTVLVASTLLVLIVAMVRDRHGTHNSAGSDTDPWIGAAGNPPCQPVADVAAPRKLESSVRRVMEHLHGPDASAAPGLAAQVMPMFLSETPRRIGLLRDAVKQRDGLEAHRVAHTLHGSAATVGAAKMVQACAEIIREVRVGSFDRCDRLLQELDRDFASIRRAAESMRPSSDFIRPV